MTFAVVVRSANRSIDDLSIYRPHASMPDTVVLYVALSLTDEQILAAVRGRLSDEELTAVQCFLGGDR
jgi:hypothetical protein